jgi:hypothetical protein
MRHDETRSACVCVGVDPGDPPQSFKGSNNVARLKEEFVELGILGKGDFGTVGKYEHRLGVSFSVSACVSCDHRRRYLCHQAIQQTHCWSC